MAHRFPEGASSSVTSDEFALATPLAPIGTNVPLFGVFLCVAPVVSRPTIQFGVRVPPGRVAAPVIERERRRFVWRSAAVAVVATAVVFAVGARTSWWPSRVVLMLLISADAGLFWSAHRSIARVKLWP